MPRIKRSALMPKEVEYFEYIKDHQRKVALVWTKLDKHLIDEFWLDDYTHAIITDLIKSHDESKFDSREFHTFRNRFFPINAEQRYDEEVWNHAWNRHQKANPHHWEYWVLPGLENEVIEMDFDYLIEMLCDWSAMSIKFKNIPSEWYAQNMIKMVLAPGTRKCIERWMPLFDKVVKECLDVMEDLK